MTRVLKYFYKWRAHHKTMSLWHVPTQKQTKLFTIIRLQGGSETVSTLYGTDG